MKNVIISFDYELFFGDEPGTVQKSLLEPTAMLMDAMEYAGAKASFFVDSFHAMVFAILFNVPFIVVANAARGLARFTSLLDLLGLSDRLVIDVTKVPFDLSNKSIDWDKVNETLATERNRCLSFLQNALAE